ncbi:hypothetical protein LXL04_038182 [Taraxacum kok-saghyz]
MLRYKRDARECTQTSPDPYPERKAPRPTCLSTAFVDFTGDFWSFPQPLPFNFSNRWFRSRRPSCRDPPAEPPASSNLTASGVQVNNPTTQTQSPCATAASLSLSFAATLLQQLYIPTTSNFSTDDLQLTGIAYLCQVQVEDTYREIYKGRSSNWKNQGVEEAL